MLALLQRFLPKAKAPMPSYEWLASWAHLKGDELKQVRGQAGFVLRNEFHGHTMRIECGQSQRDYLRGNELRMRYELALPKHFEMLVLSRRLAETLEGRTFDKLTTGHQTQVSASLPEEARWLALFERVSLQGLPPSFAKNFVVVAAQPDLARQWLEGELSSRLVRATLRWLSGDLPLVVMTLRGRLYVRTEAAMLEQGMLEGLRGIADAGATAAMALHAPRWRRAQPHEAPQPKVGQHAGIGSAEELAALDAAMMKPDVLDFEKPLPMDAFDLAQAPQGEHDDFAIEGMSVVYTDEQDLPALAFGDSHKAQGEDSRQQDASEFKLSQPAPSERDTRHRKVA